MQIHPMMLQDQNDVLMLLSEEVWRSLNSALSVNTLWVLNGFPLE